MFNCSFCKTSKGTDFYNILQFFASFKHSSSSVDFHLSALTQNNFISAGLKCFPSNFSLGEKMIWKEPGLNPGPLPATALTTGTWLIGLQLVNIS